MVKTIWATGNLGLAFALELCALVALGSWGVHVGGSLLGRIALGAALPAAAATAWGLFAAPQAAFSIPAMALLTKIVVFGAAALALWGLGRHGLAIAFPIVVLVNLAVVHYGHLGEDSLVNHIDPPKTSAALR